MKYLLSTILTFLSLSLFAQSPCNLAINVETGACSSNTTYEVWLNYTLTAPSANTQLVVFANGQSFGTFPINNTGTIFIPNFPYNGGPNDVVKVCLSTQPDCCVIKEFPVPTCLSSGIVCQITLAANPTICQGDSLYQLNLEVHILSSISSAHSYQVWVNNVLVGTYPITQSSVSLPNTHWNGGTYDAVKVCLINHPDCCKTVEYLVPTCLFTPINTCNIGLEATIGACTGDSTYQLTAHVNIPAASAAQTYQLWHNGVVIGIYPASQTTVVIPNAIWNGGPNDVIKVCLTNHPDCCKTVEYLVPTCLFTPINTCNIGLEATIGACTGDSTYQLTAHVNIPAASATQTYQLWHNGVVIGTYPASQTTVVIPNANWNGGPNDVVKVCLTNHPDCCKVVEYLVPTCLFTPTNTCHIGLEATIGACTGDSTYHLTAHINILTTSATQTYQLWHNGVVIGTYPASQTTVVIPNANWNGGSNDVIKVCLTNHPDCCKVVEFEVPGCLTQSAPCAIGPLQIQHTPCLCGQFFAVINFATNQPATAQFTVSGNNTTYGTYHYGQLPIIIGPLHGNNTTQYKFIVRDVAQPDCAEDKALGIVHCPQFASFDPVLRISPNPASTYIQVDYPDAAIDSDATLEVSNSLGQVMLTKQINRASTTFCEISSLSQGKYQVRILWSGGSASAQFIKVN